MSETDRVAVCGVGVVAPGASGAAQLLSLLETGETAIAPIERFDVSGLRASRAGLVTDFEPKDYIAAGRMRRMTRFSRLGVASARMALTDAGLDSLPYDSGRIGVAFGTTFGPVQTSVDYLNEYVEKGAALAPPQLFAESVANAPGSHVAIEFGLTGFNITFTQRASSALHALAYGASQIVKGAADAALAGGVDEIDEMTFSVLDRLGALAGTTDRSDGMSRPFDALRTGLVVGEGAATIILTREPIGKREPLGWLSGFGLGRDTTATISDWGEDADAACAVMRRAIDDAGIGVDEIDAVWASANSSIRGDRLEYRAIQTLFEDRSVPPVVAVKGYFGEYAAGGGIHLASALLAMQNQILPISIGFRTGEPEMTIPVTTRKESRSIQHLLINSFSAGGGMISAGLSRERA